MYHSDWLLRQIEQMGAVLRRMLDAIREHRPDDAVALADEAVRELLDTDPGIIDSLSGDGLVAMLSAGGELDAVRARLLAELLALRADAYEMAGHTERAGAERMRAEVLFVAVAQHVDEIDADRTAEMLGWLDP